MSFPISFEFFPTKTPEGATKHVQVRKNLYARKPQFCSVTYGAGGSTQTGTFAMVRDIQNEGVSAASHFSCVGATHDKVRAELQELKAMGVRRIVALRGDLPSGAGAAGEFRYANELVEFIRTETGDRFHIEVAAYPEWHPQAKSPRDDLAAFKRKVDAGANSAITQYFYNVDAYLNFVDAVRKMGVDIPIVPGIMPIGSFSKLARFSDACGAELPRWMRKTFESYGDDTDAIRAFGLDVVTRLCEKLIAEGAPGLHFYSMNRAGPTTEICKRLGLAA